MQIYRNKIKDNNFNVDLLDCVDTSRSGYFIKNNDEIIFCMSPLHKEINFIDANTGEKAVYMDENLEMRATHVLYNKQYDVSRNIQNVQICQTVECDDILLVHTELFPRLNANEIFQVLLCDGVKNYSYKFPENCMITTDEAFCYNEKTILNVNVNNGKKNILENVFSDEYNSIPIFMNYPVCIDKKKSLIIANGKIVHAQSKYLGNIKNIIFSCALNNIGDTCYIKEPQSLCEIGSESGWIYFNDLQIEPGYKGLDVKIVASRKLNMEFYNDTLCMWDNLENYSNKVQGIPYIKLRLGVQCGDKIKEVKLKWQI